jgi:hypothetical protein
MAINLFFGGLMEKHDFETLDNIAPYVQEHLLPEIQQSVDTCIKSYWDDDFNDMWIFGTHLWKNTWNRFRSVAEFEDCPFEVCGKGNEYKLKIGQFILRHHRINEESKLPNAAKAVKSAADQIQMTLFGEKWDVPAEIDNIVLAIDADVENGLKEVFVGELMSYAPMSNKYMWAKKVPIYLADGVKSSTAEIIQISNLQGFKQQVPAEKIAEVSVELNKSESDRKITESDLEK